MDETLNPINLDRLRDISDGDREFEGELIELFVEDQRTRLTELLDAIDRHDCTRVRELSHAVKGASANIGAETLREIALRLEQMGHDEHLDEARPALRELETGFQAIRQYLLTYHQQA